MFIMVLNDGETFTNLDGCSIVHVPDDYEIRHIEHALSDVEAHNLAASDGHQITVVTVFQDPA